MDNIGVIIASLVGTGGLGAIIALFVVPASKKWESADTRLSRLEGEVSQLKVDALFLSSGVTALSYHSNGLRTIVLRHEPSLDVQTAEQVLKNVRENIDRLTGD